MNLLRSDPDYFAGCEGTLTPGNATAAIIALSGNRYLMQLRDQKPGIFYPGHWGVFGGAVDLAEGADDCLYRELGEELGLAGIKFTPFTEITLDFGSRGLGKVVRYYYCAEITDKTLDNLRLGEGQAMEVFSATALLSMPRVVPYDSFAIWLHATRDTINFVQGPQ